MTGHSHTRNTEVERVHGHATASDVVIMADRVKDPARKVGHAREVDHMREVDHVKEADHMTETVTVLVDGTDTDTGVIVGAEVTTVTVTDESVTVTAMVTERSERGWLPRDWGKLISKFDSLCFFLKLAYWEELCFFQNVWVYIYLFLWVYIYPAYKHSMC